MTRFFKSNKKRSENYYECTIQNKQNEKAKSKTEPTYQKNDAKQESDCKKVKILRKQIAVAKKNVIKKNKQKDVEKSSGSAYTLKKKKIRQFS